LIRITHVAAWMARIVARPARDGCFALPIL